MYHPVFREHDSCSLQLKVIATARNRHTAKTWAAHNVMQFLGLRFILPELETTPLYHGAHGKWMPCCPSWWDACEFVAHPASSSLVNEAFRNQTKRWKKYGVPLQTRGLTSRDVAYAAYRTYLLFFSEIPKGSCSSQGPVMQACFRRAACHDG